jgi:hypothetical protein
LSDLQAQLRELLIQGSRTGKRLVVVIDEAQNLDDSVLEMIRMLSNFETPEAKLLQIVLVGQPALADKLAQPQLAQLRQRISIITHFPLLRGDEVEKYIQHRLRVAGYKGDRLFAPAALALIASYSRGVPRVINNLCFHALSIGYAKDRKKIDVTTLREVIADLNLESLGQGRQEAAAARQRAGAEGAGEGARERSAGKPKTAPADVDIGTQPMENGGDLWDSVDLSGYVPDWTGGAGNNPRYSAHQGRPSLGRKSNQRVEVLVALTIVAVALFAWRAPLLKPSLDFLEQAVAGEPDMPPTQENLPTVSRPEGASPSQNARVPGPRRQGTASRVPTTDVKSSAQKTTSGSPVEERSAGSPGSQLSVENAAGSPDSNPGVASATGSPDPPPSVANSTSSSDEQPSAPWRALVARNADSGVPYGRGNKGPGMIRPGKSSSVDDMGAQGVRGKLIVQSSVRGARITINGRSDPKWVTPHYFSLIAGTYIVAVSMQGYSGWAQRVHVDEGRYKWLVAQLNSDETGVLTVETEPPGMQVYIDGRPYGASRVVTVLQAGWHVCEVVPGSGVKPLVGRFHLDPGEALTKRIQVTTSNAFSGPITQAQRAGTLP